MKNLTPSRYLKSLITGAALASLLAAFPASAALIGPYTPDANTLHLWHLNDGGITSLDEIVAGNLTLTNVAQSQVPGSTINLGSPAVLAAFGTSLHIIPTNLVAGGTFAFATTNTVATLGTTSFRNASSGAFTFETLVNLDANPTNNNGNWEIVCGDSSNGSRSWQFRINTGGAGNQVPKLEFNSITASGGAMGDFFANIPTAGPDAWTTGAWFHVALTYTGNTPNNGDAPGVMTFYWTAFDTNRVGATALTNFTIAGPGTLGGNPIIGIGGSARNLTGATPTIANSEGFKGYLDEIRISGSCLASNQMLFAPTNIVFVKNPSNQVAIVGQPATFSASVAGVPPFNFQWYKSDLSGNNASLILNATNTSYTIAAATLSDATNFFITVSSATSTTVTSSVATLTIRTSADSLAWRNTAGTTSTWDYVTANWSNQVTTASPVFYQTGDNVLFAPTTNTTAISLGLALFPGSVTVSSSSNLTFAGTGNLNGSMTLTKTGNGFLTINNPNTFTGTASVSGGMIRLGNSSALGAPTTPAVATNGGTIDLNGAVTGSKGYAIQGNGFTNSGAIANFGANLQNGNGIASITLLGDASIGAQANRWDMNGDAAGSTGLQGNGFNLTKLGGNTVILIDGGANTGLGDIQILSGSLGFQGNTGMGDSNKTASVLNANLTLFGITGGLIMSKNLVLSNATISTAGGDVTFDRPITLLGTNTHNGGFQETSVMQAIYNGAIGGSGSWFKNNPGIDAFNGNNNYSGSTIISGGAVVVGAGSSLGTGPVVQLATGTTLDVSLVPKGLTLGSGQFLVGSGTIIGNVTNNPGSTLTPGINGPGTLTTFTGGLTMSSATNVIELGSDPTQLGGQNDFISIGGDLSLSGVNTIKIVPIAPLSAASPYSVIVYNSGILNGSAANLQVISDNPRYSFSVVDPSTTTPYIQISVSGVPSPLIWKGGKQPGPNTWDHTVTNWLNSGTGLFDRFYNGDLVTFDDSALTNIVSVTDTNQAGLVLFTNFAKNFTFTGPGTISGSMAQEGTGTVTLAISNTPAMNFLTNDQGTFIFNLPINASVNTMITDNGLGQGSIVKAGTNQLTLTADNSTYAGTIVVTNGALAYNNVTALGSVSFPMFITNGGTLNIAAVDTGTKPIVIAGTGFTGQGAINGGAGGTARQVHNLSLSGDATIGATARWDMGPGDTLNANGFTLTKIGGAQQWLVTVSTLNLADIHIMSSTLGFQEGTSMGDPARSIVVESNATVGLWNNGITFLDKQIVLTNGGIIFSGGGSNTLVGPITLYSNNNSFICDTELHLNGPIQGSGGVSKFNAATVYFDGTNTYSGATRVGSASRLVVGANSSLGSSVNIQIDGGSTIDASLTGLSLAGQRLQGSGTLQGNATLGIGAMIAPGDAAGLIGTLTLNGNLNCGTLSTSYFEYNKTAGVARDLITGLQTVTYGGTLIASNIGATTLTGTDTLKLFNAVTYTGSFTSIVPASPGPGLAWNTNTLTTDGTLRVTVTVNATPTNIVTQLSGNQLTLSWPADHIGWRLQTETNSILSGLGTNWVDVAGSTQTNQMTFTILPSNGTVFYRMKYP